jgi:hypothetical protein
MCLKFLSGIACKGIDQDEKVAGKTILILYTDVSKKVLQVVDKQAGRQTDSQ